MKSLAAFRWKNVLPMGILFVVLGNTVFAASDFRFYGDYCGSHRESKSVWVPLHPLFPIPVEKTFHMDFSIRAHSGYVETNSGNGLINGRGKVQLTGHNFPDGLAERYGLTSSFERSFVFSGGIRRYGYVKGSGLLAGVEPVSGTMVLSEDGNGLTVRGLDRTFQLNKLECGNEPPVARITTSADTFAWGRVNHLAGAVDDDGAEPFTAERLVWRSSRDRDWVQYGFLVPLDELTPGEHMITFTATDYGGLRDVAEKTVQIENNAPNTVLILSPEVDEEYCAGQPIPFDGWATDEETGNLTYYADETFRWSYGDDIFIGRGNPLARTLPVGAHTITLMVSDGSASVSESVNILVRDPSEGPCPPTVSIRKPENTHVIGSGPDDCILLQVDEAYDIIDGDLSGAAIVWQDVRSGVVEREYTGREVEACGFFADDADTPHTIRVTATNSRGESRSASRNIFVLPTYGGPY